MKKKFLSLGLAVMLLLSVTGCAMTTPATVGTIGGVEIPAGIYLLSQYNAYQSASSGVDFSTGESAKQVAKTLKATTDTAVGDDKTVDTVANTVEKLTTRSLEYYAAVEAKFDELGGTLEDAATAEAASSADSDWESTGDTYTANGISKNTVEDYYLNQQKAKAIPALIYGADGSEPISTAEYTSYIQDSCVFADTIVFPLYDMSSYIFATADQQTAIEALARQCADELNEQATAETSASDMISNMFTAAQNYLPQVFTAMGSTSFDASQSYNYVSEGLYPADGENAANSQALRDAAKDAGLDTWTVVNMGMSFAVARYSDPLADNTAEELATNFDLMTAMKGDEVEASLYSDGAAMEHALNTSAINTYKASKIKMAS